MISKLLYALERGVRVATLHSKFLLIGVLLILFPLVILSINEKVQSTSLENVKTAEKETIQITHAFLEGSVSSEESFLVAAGTLDSELRTEPEFYLFSEVNGAFILATTSDLFGVVSISDFVVSTAPSSGEVFIFEDESPSHRHWVAASQVRTTDNTYVVVSAHNYTDIDAVIKERSGDTYLSLGFGALLLILIAYWLLRQINWEQKHKGLLGRLEEQKMLTTTITHEFRAPLTAIAGHISFLRESNRLRPRDLQSLEQMELSVERLRHLVNDFLEVAKIQSGTMKTSVTNVSIESVVHQVLATLGPDAAKKELALKDGTRDTTIMLQTDEERLVQVLLNLVNNAIKYSSEGDITITYEKNPLYLTMRVQDTGTGISAADQKNLFKPFSRVGGVDNTAIVGSGLGMWITKQLVGLLGGTIDVESIKDVGTHVVVTFDLRKIAKNTREGIL